MHRKLFGLRFLAVLILFIAIPALAQVTPGSLRRQDSTDGRRWMVGLLHRLGTREENAGHIRLGRLALSRFATLPKGSWCFG